MLTQTDIWIRFKRDTYHSAVFGSSTLQEVPIEDVRSISHGFQWIDVELVDGRILRAVGPITFVEYANR